MKPDLLATEIPFLYYSLLCRIQSIALLALPCSIYVKNKLVNDIAFEILEDIDNMYGMMN